MDKQQLHKLLEDVRGGSVDVDHAMERLRHLPFEDLGFAMVDHHRALRCGMPEVVFGKGKTAHQIVEIAKPCPGPSSQCPNYGGNETSLIVLELPGGTAKKLGVAVGEFIKL